MKTYILQLGEEVLSADCKVTYKCIMSNGAAKVTEEASENCHDNAVCHQNADGALRTSMVLFTSIIFKKLLSFV
jgi:hypothetical protein